MLLLFFHGGKQILQLIFGQISQTSTRGRHETGQAFVIVVVVVGRFLVVVLVVVVVVVGGGNGSVWNGSTGGGCGRRGTGQNFLYLNPTCQDKVLIGSFLGGGLRGIRRSYFWFGF